MRVMTFAEIEGEFRARIARDRCCNLATIDAHDRPRSRTVHPLWEGLICWVLTDRHSPKVRHIAARPFVSLAYIGDPDRTLYAECHARQVEEKSEIARVWTLFADSPLGYDPALYYSRADHPDLAVLKLTPWRIQIDDTGGETLIWEPPSGAR